METAKKISKSIVIIEADGDTNSEFDALSAELLPEVNVHKLMDPSFLPSIIVNGGATSETNRILYKLYEQAQMLNADMILHACTVASGIVDLVKPFVDAPILRIDAPAIWKAVEKHDVVTIVGTAPLALAQSAEFARKTARQEGKKVDVREVLLSSTSEEEVRRIFAHESGSGIVLCQPSLSHLTRYAGNEQHIYPVTRNAFIALRNLLTDE